MKKGKTKNKKLWFKAKTFGWGWVPVTWQGWLITLIFIAFITYMAMFYLVKGRLVEYFVSLIASMIILMYICFKTGEKPRWRWGK
jgi:hypothetical protein